MEGDNFMKRALTAFFSLVVLIGYSSFILYAADSGKASDGKVSKYLGEQSTGFGSSGQSQELLKLFNSTPGKIEYEITYITDVDAVVFKFNLSSNELTRIHRYKDGRITQEIWNGYVTERLENASGGGSLNDTPVGKSPGSYKSF
jgi:hypothetical protein